MPSTHLHLREDDVVRLALEFLHRRDLHISQLSLERETGVINGNYADDILFLRQLILDGQWDDVIEFIQPLSALQDFQADKVNYAILRHKYIELLCIKSEIKGDNNVEMIVDEVVKLLSDLEKLAPSKEEYSNLCLLLTLPSITDHLQFKTWNPSNARVQCFREVYPLVDKFLSGDKKFGNTVPHCAKNDRLMQLLIKGILYESCVNFCQAKASGNEVAQTQDFSLSRLLDGPGFDESDISLLSWVQSLPAETFTVPFEQRMLNVEVEKLERPSLHTSWTEHMLVTPIKPRTFPHLAMPFHRPRSAADAMTRSLRPLPDGAPRVPAVMALSAIDYGPSTSCYAGFHLAGVKGSKLMNTSVDRLFRNKTGESIVNSLSEPLKPIVEQSRPGASGVGPSTATAPERREHESAPSPVHALGDAQRLSSDAHPIHTPSVAHHPTCRELDARNPMLNVPIQQQQQRLDFMNETPLTHPSHDVASLNQGVISSSIVDSPRESAQLASPNDITCATDLNTRINSSPGASSSGRATASVGATATTERHGRQSNLSAMSAGDVIQRHSSNVRLVDSPSTEVPTYEEFMGLLNYRHRRLDFSPSHDVASLNQGVISSSIVDSPRESAQLASPNDITCLPDLNTRINVSFLFTYSYVKLSMTLSLVSILTNS